MRLSEVSSRTSPPPSARSVALWGVLDQIVSSAANFVFVVAVARSVAPEEFGAVALTFEIYLLTVIVTRGVAGDTLMARFSGRQHDALDEAVRKSSLVAVLAGVLAGVLAATSAAFVDDRMKAVLVVLAVGLPFLILQDFVRQALITQGRARSACLNDLIWGILQLPALAGATWLSAAPAAFLIAWAAAGGVAAVIGVRQLRLGLPRRHDVSSWLTEHRALWPYLLGENLVLAAGSFAVVLTISAVAGLVGLAAFRAVMTLYAPLATLGRGVLSVAVNLLARRRTDPSWIGRSALTLSWLMAPAALLWGALLTTIPDAVGEAGFGESWQGAGPLVFVASFPCAVALFSVGASSGMRALDAGRFGFGARVAVSLTALAAFTTGVLTDGVRGAFEVFAWSTPIQLAIWWWLLHRAARRAENRALIGA